MSWMGAMTAGFLLRSALGGGLILLLAYLGLRLTGQPARQQRLGEWGLMAALLLVVLSVLPGFLIVPLPVNSKSEPVPLAQTTPEPWLETRASPPSQGDPQTVAV